MPPRRYKAPTGNGEVLADPPFRCIPELVARNCERLDRADVVIGGMPLRELRALARREVGVSGDGPLLLMGHEPELSHPGVWVKHFAVHGLAKRCGGTSLNLIVDHDTLKSTALRVPSFHRHDPAAVRLESIAYDRFVREVPYETREVLDAEVFRTFPERVADVCRTWSFEPLLPRVWEAIVTHPAPTIGAKFTAARQQWERAWGCQNFEVPVSQLSRTQAFRVFAQGIAANPEFRLIYNAAVARYRKSNHVRSRNHPVPDLRDDELPFWGPVTAKGRRERLTGHTITDPSQVRPRALTLTLFARVCLGDFFIHGIGGGKYDEVTDAIIREFFGIGPPAYQVVSATLLLPLPEFPTTPEAVTALARRERDVYWNPQRHVPAPEAERPEVRELVRRHRQLVEREPFVRVERRQWFRDLRSVGDQLREILLPRMGEAHDWLARARQEVAANAVLHRRDFAWVLYPEATLRPFLTRFLEV